MSKKSAKRGGQTRANTALRDSRGRFTTNEFKREVLKTVAAKKGFNVSGDETAKDRAKVDEILKAARITNRELNSEYKRNIEMFSDMLENGGTHTPFRNSSQIEKDIDQYKGKFIIEREDGTKEQVSKTQMKLELKKYKQLLSSQLEVPDFAQKNKLTFDGKMIIKVPNLKLFRRKIKEYNDGEVEDDEMFETDPDIVYYRSPKKKK